MLRDGGFPADARPIARRPREAWRQRNVAAPAPPRPRDGPFGAQDRQHFEVRPRRAPAAQSWYQLAHCAGALQRSRVSNGNRWDSLTDSHDATDRPQLKLDRPSPPGHHDGRWAWEHSLLAGAILLLQTLREVASFRGDHLIDHPVGAFCSGWTAFGSVRGRPAGSIIVCVVSSQGIHINRVACTQNVKGLAASNKDPSASKDGVARRLIDICSQSPFGDCR